MKQVLLGDGQNAAVDFHLFTEVPKAARGVGLINNDVAITLDPNNPDPGGEGRSYLAAHLGSGLQWKRADPGLHRPVRHL